MNILLLSLAILASILFILAIIALCIVSFPSTKGWAGEMLTAFVIKKNLPEDSIVFNDLYFHNGKKSCQIDHLVICPQGIFVFETKNYLGKVTGYVLNDKIHRKVLGMSYSMKNPVKQNDYHIKYLQDYLPEKYQAAIRSVIVFVFMTRLHLYGDTKDLAYPCYIGSLSKIKNAFLSSSPVLTHTECRQIADIIRLHNRRKK